MTTDDTYLIWSAEHGAWWGPGRNGYVRRLSDAGHYPRRVAIDICTTAIPGTAETMGALPEMPVRLEDIEEMQERHHTKYPGRDPERWE
jgi:hypothetical protein